MTKIAICLVHNKTDTENFNQVENLVALVKKNTVLQQGEIVNEDGTTETITYETYYYTIDGLTTPHEAKFYQIVPFGVTPPSNFYSLDSHNVLYAKGDEDKTADHPRFFNWAMKRAIDYGAQVVLKVDDIFSLNLTELANKIAILTNNEDPIEFVEIPVGNLTTPKLLTVVGQLNEDLASSDAINDFKQRVVSGGLENG